MKNSRIYTMMLLFLAATLVLSACQKEAEGASVATSAAQTVEALGIGQTAVAQALVALSATAAAAPSATPQPTELPTRPVATDSGVGVATIRPTDAGVNNSAASYGTIADKAAFISETIPDGTTYSPGASFTKTWRLRNDGTSTWTTYYELIYVNGDQMGGPSSKAFTANVPPGTTVDISVDLVAPANNGTYRGYWMLRNANGGNFGIGPNGTGTFYVEIKVGTVAASPTITPTGPTATAGPTATVTATLAPGVVINTFQITSPDAPRPLNCGDYFDYAISGSITASAAGTVTYNWKGKEAKTLTFTGPGTQPVDLYINSGNAPLNISIELSVTSPFNLITSKVFPVDCQ